jgi:hypothetical protein
MDSYKRLFKTLQETTIDLIAIKDYDHDNAKFSQGLNDNNDMTKEIRFDDRNRPLIKEEADLLKEISDNEIEWMKSKLNGDYI